MKVKSESEDTHSYLTLSDPMDCSLPGSSAHGIFQVRVLEWVAIAFSSVLSYWSNKIFSFVFSFYSIFCLLGYSDDFQTPYMWSHKWEFLKLFYVKYWAIGNSFSWFLGPFDVPYYCEVCVCFFFFFFFVTFWHYKTLPRSTCVGSSPNLLDSAVVSRISGVFFVCLFACLFFFFFFFERMV